MSRDPRLYLDDILESIEAVDEYTQDMDEERFFSSRLIQDAVFRRLEVIGEAARQLPQEIKDSHPGVPWADIVGMRNRLTHEYFGVLLDRVWNVVRRDLPVLRAQIEAVRNAAE